METTDGENSIGDNGNVTTERSSNTIGKYQSNVNDKSDYSQYWL